jgi:dephospho-CoA kinase
MTTEKLIIGLIGEKGSGKETVGNFILELVGTKKAVRIRFSDILAETLTLWNLPLNRNNLQYMAIIMNQQFGAGTLTEAMRNRMKTIKADVIIIDGLRWETDIELLRSFPNNKLIYVTADEQTRYERIKARKEKIGEGSVTFDKFREEELMKNEILIPSLGKEADVTIVNDSDLEKLRAKVEKALRG